MTQRRGVAILANDEIYDWLLPFLDSYRQHNPDLPTYLIPFDDRMDRTARAAAVYDVAVVDADFTGIDRFAAMLYPFNRLRYRHRLRKFHCLALPLDEVMYIDVDTIVFRDMSVLFGKVKPGSADFIIASTSPEWVYTKRMHDYPELANAILFSDGFFVTSPAILSLERLIDTVSSRRAIFRAVRKWNTYAQPVANFAVHSLGLKIASLTDLMPEASCETFYLAKGVKFGDGGPWDVDGREIFFAHWAGAKLLPSHDLFSPAWHHHAARAASRVGPA
jgi:hypothetical protein